MAQQLHPLEYYRQELRHLPPTFRTRDGKLLYARLIRPEDAPLLLELFERLSSETRHRRFHADADHVSEERKQQVAQHSMSINRTKVEAEERCTPSGVNHIVRVCALEGSRNMPEAEAAIVVRDDYQGRGVGTELLRRLGLLAKQMCVTSVLAVIEAHNVRALRVFRNMELPYAVTTRRGETQMTIQVPQIGFDNPSL